MSAHDPRPPDADSPDEQAPRASPPVARFDPRDPRATHPRLVWWLAVALMAATTFVSAAAVLHTFYTPEGVVRAYLADLARGDAAAALSIPGADPSSAELARAGLPAHPSRQLLDATSFRGLDVLDVRAQSVVTHGVALQRVAADVREGTVRRRILFSIRSSGSVLGLLPTWSFHIPPVSVVNISIPQGHAFTTAGSSFDTTTAGRSYSGPEPGVPVSSLATSADYLVLAPTSLTVGYRSTLAVASPTTTPVLAPDQLVHIRMVQRATPELTRLVQGELDRRLSACTDQHVLEPTGCPFGASIDDRVLGSPLWRITRFPSVQVMGGSHGWESTTGTGTARLTAQVQSLFDGTTDTRTTEHSFTVHVTALSVTRGNRVTLDLAAG